VQSQPLLPGGKDLPGANTLSAIQGGQDAEARYLPLVLKPVIPALLCAVMILAGIGLEVGTKARLCRTANPTSITRLLFTFQKRARAGGHLRTAPLRSSIMSIHIHQCSSLWYVFHHFEATVKALFGVGGSPSSRSSGDHCVNGSPSRVGRVMGPSARRTNFRICSGAFQGCEMFFLLISPLDIHCGMDSHGPVRALSLTIREIS
jgi:hypothetical protein